MAGRRLPGAMSGSTRTPRATPTYTYRVTCRIAGDQLTVDMTGSDARPELVNVWNTFANTRGYAIAQLASMVDPDINKNEGLFYAVEMVIPEGSILQPAPNKPAALGSFHPAVEVGEAICIALSPILPQRSCAAGVQTRHAQCGHRLQRRGRNVDGPGRGCARLRCLRHPGTRWLGRDVRRTRQPDSGHCRRCREPLSGISTSVAR